MKHTSFATELADIKAMAAKELKRALEAHGGKYDYTQFDPVPVAGGEKVLNATISPANYIWIETEDSVWTLDDLHIEDITKLTDYIANTDEVNDVSGVYPSPVLWIDTDDIESCGFNAEGIGQGTLDEMGVYLAGYFDDSFQEALIETCRHYGLKEKED